MTTNDTRAASWLVVVRDSSGTTEQIIPATQAADVGCDVHCEIGDFVTVTVQAIGSDGLPQHASKLDFTSQNYGTRTIDAPANLSHNPSGYAVV